MRNVCLALTLSSALLLAGSAIAQERPAGAEQAPAPQPMIQQPGAGQMPPAAAVQTPTVQAPAGQPAGAQTQPAAQQAGVANKPAEQQLKEDPAVKQSQQPEPTPQGVRPPKALETQAPPATLTQMIMQVWNNPVSLQGGPATHTNPQSGEPTPPLSAPPKSD